MTYRVLISAPYMIPELARLQPVFERAGVEVIAAEVRERLEEKQLLAYAGQIDGAICGDDRFTARILETAAPRLRVISKWGTGIDSIDLQAAERTGVQVFNTPDAFTEPVADSVMGYVLAFARRLFDSDRDMQAGRWTKVPGRALKECTLGVVGVGRIGKAVLTRASAFGMRLLGNDIIEVDPAFRAALDVQLMSLPDILQASDFVSLNCDLNPSSRHLINEKTLARMRSGAVLINTARGAVVDEGALASALKSGKLAGAALDVFEDEPLPANSPLRGIDNVLLAPHNSNASPAAWEWVHWNTIRNLFEGLGLPRPESSPEVQAALGATKPLGTAWDS